jgi:pyruvate/2-oxoglutarate dehydrogenase complex dihydrolipoamide dehydrogenase (E3) component
MRSFDVIVIGLGPGGEEVAARTADAGLSVLGIDRKLVGGECPYWGCIPSKVMVRAAGTLGEAARALGLAGEGALEPRWDKVASRVREVTDDWHDAAPVARHEARGTTVLHGTGRLIGPGEVEVDGERFTASRAVVLAAGSSPAIAPIEGIGDVPYWTNREAIETEEVPGSLVVIGAGAVGLELAQVFQRFGSRVTIIEPGPRVLPAEEPENGEALGAALLEDGIDVRTGVGVERVAVHESGDGVTVSLAGGDAVDADRLLLATGRRADPAALGVDAVGLDPDARAVEIDGRCRAAEGVWAVGDLTGKGMFTHVAVYQGRIAADDILGLEPTPADYTAVPRVTFTDPEVASVGLSERQAREAGLEVAVAVERTDASSRGYVHGPGTGQGVTKLVADTRAGVLVGASLMGPAAGEVLGMLVLAIRHRVPLAQLRDLIYPYPTWVRGIESALSQLPS